MFHRFQVRGLAVALLVGLVVGVAATATAGAAASKAVKCVGTADFCGATVSIAGGASNKVVTIKLTDTNFKRIAVRVFPSSSKGAFSITKAATINGGSEYRFTLNAVKSNPKGARIVLLFAAGTPA